MRVIYVHITHATVHINAVRMIQIRVHVFDRMSHTHTPKKIGKVRYCKRYQSSIIVVFFILS